MMTQKEKIGFYSIGVNVLLVALKGGLAVFSHAGVDVMLTGGQNLAAIQHKIKKKTDEVPHQNYELKGEKRDD